MYTYRPVRFYVTVFCSTWAFWLFAILFNEGASCTIGLLLGLVSPATVAASCIVLLNRDMFFEKRHLSHILE